MVDSHGTLGNIILQGQAITSVFLIDWLMVTSPLVVQFGIDLTMQKRMTLNFLPSPVECCDYRYEPPGKATSGLSQFAQTNPATYERELHMSTERLWGPL